MSDELPDSDGGLVLTGGEVTVGSLIAGYRVEEKIGRGGMAVVYRAHDERLGRQVALKVLAPALAAEEAFRQRFIRESRAAAAVDDPHIIPVYEAGDAGGLLFIAMRYVAGGDVQTLVRRRGPLSSARAAAIVSPIAAALDAAHSSDLVHRDVKLANMLLDARPGRPDHVYLSDFGLSKQAISASSWAGLTGSGQLLGTPDYLSPEQIAGRPLDGRSDQYALACAVFELLTGKPPFQRDHPTAVIYAHTVEPPPVLTSRRADLPLEADAVLVKALAKMPDERYATCEDFAESLRAAPGLPPYGAERDTSEESHPATVMVGLPPPLDGLELIPGAQDTVTRAVKAGAKIAAVLADDALPERHSAAGRSKPWYRRRAVVAAVAAVTLISGAVGVAAWQARGSNSKAWPLRPLVGEVTGVSAGPNGSAWAIGSTWEVGRNGSIRSDKALILRWNGIACKREPYRPALRDVVPLAVSAGPGSSAWAIGSACPSSCYTSSTAAKMVILHWDGAAWSRVRSPSLGDSPYLNSVSVGPNGSAWAVGGTWTASGAVQGNR